MAGTVSVNKNMAGSSRAMQASELYGGGDANGEEEGGIRLGQEVSPEDTQNVILIVTTQKASSSRTGIY